jgi:hypothetical protein
MTSTRAVRTARSTHPTTTLLGSVPRRFNDCILQGPACCRLRIPKPAQEPRPSQAARIPSSSAPTRFRVSQALLHRDTEGSYNPLPAARIPIVPRLRLTC